MTDSVICLSRAHVVIGELEDLNEAARLLTESAFQHIERLVEELRQSLESEAEQRLVRRTYSVEVTFKPGARELVAALDLFDVRLRWKRVQ